jgi:signal transduction histidine kinase
MSVRLRLTLLYGGVFLLSGAVLLAITFVLVGQTTSAPNYVVRGTARGPVVSGPHGAVAVSVFQIRTSGPGHGAGSETGTVITQARGASAATAAVPGGHRSETTEAETAKAEHVYFKGNSEGALPSPQSLPVKLPPGGPPLTLAQAQAQAHKLQALARQQHSDELHELLVDLGIALAIMAIVSMGLGWFIAGRVLRPLQTITKAARAISAKSLHRRLALSGPRDELRELGDTFDDLLERLERSFEAQRQFVANASHELRTPLTLERAIVEVTLADPRASNETLRATCERVLVIGEQQERMIDALLALARSERGLERHDPFDLGALTRDVIVTRSPEIARRGLRLESDLGEAPTRGDASLAERLIANLIDNAVRHNAADGWVSVTAGAGDGRAILTVSNSGPVVPDEEVERLLRPFQRMGAARASHGDGHGLGLSLVSAVAAAHGASLRARARPEGGLEISVSFPAAGPPSELDGDASAPAALAHPAPTAAGAGS